MSCGLDIRGMSDRDRLILSDQCPWHFRIESGTGGVIRVTEGSMLKQMEDCLDIIDGLNERIRRPHQPGVCRRFPTVAIKEAVYNAVIHRDYDDPSDTVVTIADDAVSIESPGTVWFPDEWDIKLLLQPRNPDLGHVIVGLGMARLNGRGLRLVKNAYRRTGSMPRIVARDDSFLVTLPAIEQFGDSLELKCGKVMEFMEENHGATVRDLSDMLMTSISQTRRILDRMEDRGMVFRTGQSSHQRYFLSEAGSEYLETCEGDDGDEATMEVRGVTHGPTFAHRSGIAIDSGRSSIE